MKSKIADNPECQLKSPGVLLAALFLHYAPSASHWWMFCGFVFERIVSSFKTKVDWSVIALVGPESCRRRNCRLQFPSQQSDVAERWVCVSYEHPACSSRCVIYMSPLLFSPNPNNRVQSSLRHRHGNLYAANPTLLVPSHREPKQHKCAVASPALGADGLWISQNLFCVSLSPFS